MITHYREVISDYCEAITHCREAVCDYREAITHCREVVRDYYVGGRDGDYTFRDSGMPKACRDAARNVSTFIFF